MHTSARLKRSAAVPEGSPERLMEGADLLSGAAAALCGRPHDGALTCMNRGAAGYTSSPGLWPASGLCMLAMDLHRLPTRRALLPAASAVHALVVMSDTSRVVLRSAYLRAQAMNVGLSCG